MLEIGSTIGTYRILRQLGIGGMGAVFVAEHTLLGRKAAIKALLPEVSANKDIVQRFFNEARAVTQIADPGIVQVFDFGYDERGNAYIVMELLEGETLAERIQRTGRVRALDTVRLMRLSCLSLQAAHAKGIIHRDLKPENIFIVADPAVAGGERAKLLDFGIAKLSREDGVAQTGTGAMMGTPLYMSPEQCRGAGEVDHRSDIYSIGCVMLTTLTGSPPFGGTGSGELIVAHMQAPPPFAASRVAGIPPIVDQILQRCLAKDPAHRFQTMAELADVLGQAEQQLLYSPVAPGAPTYAPTPVGMVTQATGAVPPAHVAAMPTTLSSAAGVTTPPRSRRRGPIIAALAGTVLAGGIIVAVMASRGTGTEPAAPSPGSARTVTIDAPLATAPPPAIDASVAAVPPPAIDAGVAEAVVVDAGVKSASKHPAGKPHGRPAGAGSSAPATTVDRGD